MQANRTALAAALCATLAGALATAPAGAQDAAPAAYRNPLTLRLASGEPAQNCADPAVLRDPRADQGKAGPTWYLYCGSDPVSQRERDRDGWHLRLVPIYRSHDLVHWDFVADAFDQRPPGLAAPTSGLAAPEPAYVDGRYYLYFTVTDVADEHSPVRGCTRDSAIGVATADSPAGPWTAQSAPVVGPRQAGPGCDFHGVSDPKLVLENGQKYLLYGGRAEGVWSQRLGADGLSVVGGARRVGAAGRFESPELVRREGWWYLFASTPAGAGAAAAIEVGRARSVSGPFLDRDGRDLAAGGGTLFLTPSGARWSGAGHNTLVQDTAGQWWTLFHAVDAGEPYFSAPERMTRRQLLLERVDWIDGWPAAAGADPEGGAMPMPSTGSGA